jgi:tight adherence protein B
MPHPLAALAAATSAAAGVHLLWTAAHGHRRVLARRRPRLERRVVGDWLVQAGLGGVHPAEFAGVMAILSIVGSAGAFAVFGGVLPALVAGAFAATFPPASYRRRRATRLAKAQEAWPRMIEEIRILTGSLGRSIPQALFDVGRRGPDDLRPAFAAAHREWLLSTDFERTLQVLKDRLADPTADAACETLLIAHELGGADLDRRLAALAEDRMQDTHGRKDARAKQERSLLR